MRVVHLRSVGGEDALSRTSKKRSIRLPRALLVLAVSLAGAVPFSVWAADAQAGGDHAQSAAPRRPRVGLVLSGGGARGFAHVGVLKVLREMNIPVDVVAGTSMGAIVGGSFAAGYTPEQLEKLVRTTDWEELFSRRAPRADLSWRRKQDDFKNLSNFEFGIKPDGLTLPQGLAGTQQLELSLRALGGPVKEIRDLAQLPLPFAAMATDLLTGRPVELQHDISLSTAMRASMAVPGAFAPLEYDGKLLVDGGVVDNFPVAAARRMGAEIIIAVNVGTPLLPREKLGDVVGVAEQLSLILGLESIERGINSLGADDILITPDLTGISSSDFAAGERIIAAGAAAARTVAPKLAAYAVAPVDFAMREENRTRLVRADAPVEVTQVVVTGVTAVSADAVRAEVDIAPGRKITTAEIERNVQRVYGGGDFEVVDYNLIDAGPQRLLLIRPYEKSWGYNTLRFGFGLQTNFRDDSTFNLLAAHTWRWLNRWGGEWRNEVQIGQKRRLLTEFAQPLGAGSDWFVLPRAQSEREEFDVFENTDAVARYENVTNEAQLLVGYGVPRLGVVSAGVARARLNTTLLVGERRLADSGTETSTANVGLLQARLDTLDSVAFPRHGAYLGAQYRVYQQLVGSAPGAADFDLDATLPVTVGAYTLNLSGRAAKSVQQGSLRLGGMFNLSGTPSGAVNGSRLVLVRVIVVRNISDTFGDISMPVYAGLSAELGQAAARAEDLRLVDLRRAGAIFIGADSVIGPLYFGFGRTSGGSNALYLSLGRPQ